MTFTIPEIQISFVVYSFIAFMISIYVCNCVALLDKGHKIQPYCGPKEKDIDAADDSPGI